MARFAEKPIHEFTIEQWEQFLADEPPDAGIRLKLRKKSSSAPGITWQEALDVALCYGWIDGQAGRFDDDYTLQAFTPRRKNSPWSQINREHVARLIAEGRMRPGGHAEVERAKADGRWDAAYRQKGAVGDIVGEWYDERGRLLAVDLQKVRVGIAIRTFCR